MELRLAGQDVCQEHRFQSWRDDPSSLGSSQSMGDLDREDVGMVQKRVTAQGWLGSTPEGQRPRIRGLRAGGSLAVASSIPATQLSSPARLAERVVTPQ
jgi:hypothetical protein